MTNEEAIKTIEVAIAEVEWNYPMNYAVAFETAISALEKQIPKKPIEDDYYDEPAVCPNCGGNIINIADNDYHFQHCHYCGQALDWSDTNDKNRSKM